MNPHDHTEEAEFEAFLKGEGDLARSLQELPQPQAPEALSAAILARAASDMRGAAAPANDAVHHAAPASPPARHFLRRTRVPLGLAASAVFALFAVRSLMPQFDAPMAEQPVAPAAAPQQATTPIAAPQQPIAPISVPQEATAPIAAPQRATAPSVVVAKAPVVVAAAPAEEASRTATELAPPPSALNAMQAKRSMARAAPAADIAAAVAAADAEAAAPPAMAARSAPMAARAPLALMQAPVMASAASKPNAMTYFGSPQAEALPAPTWLARIADMLKAGETKEAHTEWLKFRMRYPDTEVPPELQRQLEAIN